MALLSGLVTRLTPLREDASFAAFYLISLALGVLLVSTHGSNVDLLHLLFGSILAIDDAALDADRRNRHLEPVVARGHLPPARRRMLRSRLPARGRRPRRARPYPFLALVVLNLVAGFQALGTLMAVGLMMLPAAAARFWVRELWSLSAVSSALAFASGFLGLLLSYHLDLPSGPSIVLVAGLGLFRLGPFRPARQLACALFGRG